IGRSQPLRRHTEQLRGGLRSAAREDCQSARDGHDRPHRASIPSTSPAYPQRARSRLWLFASRARLLQGRQALTPLCPLSSSPDRFTTYVLGMFLLVGVIFLVIAGVMLYKQRSFIAESNRSTGQVVDVVLDRTQRQAAPVVVYSWQGEERTHTGAFSQGLS